MVSKIENELPAALAALYNEILDAGSSTTEVYVIGYPLVVRSDGVCPPFDDTVNNYDPLTSEAYAATLVINKLNLTISNAVDAVRADRGTDRLHFISATRPGSPFEFHDLCSSDSYFEAVNWPFDQEYSFHPNATGQRAYALLISRAISGSN